MNVLILQDTGLNARKDIDEVISKLREQMLKGVVVIPFNLHFIGISDIDTAAIGAIQRKENDANKTE